MTKRFDACFLIWFVLALFYQVAIQAQVPVAPNGRFATVKGLKLYYEETGNGMPLLLMSGFGRTASDWQPFTPQLSKYFRVIALDIPGHGRSDYMDTTDVYLHKKAAEYILGLLDLLHIDSVHVLGASSGGFITLYIATLRPQLAKKIVVVGGQVYYSTTTRKVITGLGGPEKNPILPLEALLNTHGNQKGTLLARQFWNFRNVYGDPSFTADILSTIKAKALIIHGDNDPIAPVSNAWDMYQNIPKAHLWVVPNGGHVPFAVPGNQDEFVRRVVEFLQGDWDRK
ncbi:alpha/beta fold hydrolase [Spirosoma validum]|uniref:Alpha/beta hydrolase n=1 Tax=Spirosoma validum TaxID=2771355 RepID=A0A927B4M1_9BACT|nr:alpha/beta hydrolase [Spirosoma validum]MBD2755278.1 alpha/beta hydrolase [Spirosoma validum]